LTVSFFALVKRRYQLSLGAFIPHAPSSHFGRTELLLQPLTRSRECTF
jgi:hypothetical protein